jgi:hypothetical protein
MSEIEAGICPPTRWGSAQVPFVRKSMRFRLPILALLTAVFSAFSNATLEASDADYAAVSARILARIGALKAGSPSINWSEEIKRAVVAPDGSGAFSMQREVEWVLDRPGEPPSKQNGRRPVYRPGGFWINLTFYRGTWKGAAVFRPIDFGDLHLWLDYGYKDDPAIVRAIAAIVEEEQRAFQATRPK